MSVLPDLLRPGLAIVFCGTAPSRKSAARQAYYAHGGNLFWDVLFQTGLTPTRFAPADYPCLIELGIGLTDLNKIESGVDATLDRRAFDVPGLTAKILSHRPRVLAFTSKHGATIYYGGRPVEYGRQLELLGETVVWVLPSTSGSARPHWPRLAHHWFELADWVRAS